MNIKEVENKTGITRANIRFYEKKKLICPRRSDNGYRDYSEDDIANLQRIKLLRLLYVPLEEIKKLEDGKASFKDVMESNVSKLNKEMEQYKVSRDISDKISKEVTDYKSMSSEKYIMEIENSEEKCIAAERLKEDTLDSDGAVWCRYFARVIDATLLTGIINFLAPDILHSWVSELSTIMSIIWAFLFGIIYSVIAIIVEPFFISVFKATPGKFIFGIKVEHEEGRRLKYSEAIKRTAGVMWYGTGLNMPVIDIVRMLLSYDKYSKGEILQWDKNVMSYVDTEDMNKWRVLLGILVVIILEIKY